MQLWLHIWRWKPEYNAIFLLNYLLQVIFPYTDKWRTLQEDNMSIHMKHQAPSMRHGHLIIIIIVVVNANETHSIFNISWRTQRRRNQYLTDLFSLIINVELLMEVIHGTQERLHTIYVKNTIHSNNDWLFIDTKKTFVVSLLNNSWSW